MINIALLIALLIGCGGTILDPQNGASATRSSQPAVQSSVTDRDFAFWYESWTAKTWGKLQPANVIIGVPVQAVPDIHKHGGRALNYVTFYQARFGSYFLKDANDLSNIGFHTPAGFLASTFGGQDNFVLCSNSQALRARAVSFVNTAIATNNFDGLFIDNTYLAPASKLVCDAKHPHVNPGENGGSAYIDLLKVVHDAVKQSNPSALIITNPGNPNSFKAGSHGLTLWDVSDYVLWESYVYTSHASTGHFRPNSVSESFSVAKRGASRIIALAYPMSASEALFSYAVAKVFGFNYAANLGANQQAKPSDGGHFGIFAAGLPRLMGTPIDQLPGENSVILTRHYSNGVVVLNRSGSDFATAAETNGMLYTQLGSKAVAQGDSILVPKGQAVILIKS